MKPTDALETEDAVNTAGLSAESVRLAVIIPAYRPEPKLLELIAALSEKSIPAIVLVDDGSGPEYGHIFERAREFEKVRLVRHAVNLGKGAALKSGINYALCTYPSLAGVVTADADGQHHPDDIEQVAEKLAAEPDRLVLGARTFGADVPLRSRFGNIVTRAVMRALAGQQVSDTQTGLRGIPAALLPRLLRLEANGYDFELDMLIAVRQQAMRIAEIPIRTIYEPGNRTSHFNPLVDSMKIYFVLLRFSSVSLASAALDMLVFYLAYRRLGNIAASQVIARILSVVFNYSMVRRAVFYSKLRHASVLPKYLLLVCASGSASYAGIQLLNSRLHWPAMLAKIAVETLLFFANFAIQRDFIFGRTPSQPRLQPGQPPWIDRIPRWIPHTILAVMAAILLGIVVHGIGQMNLSETGWTEVGRHRLLHYTWIFALLSSLAIAAIPRFYPLIVALLSLAAILVAIGPLAVLVTAVFLISACALGSKLLSTAADVSAESQLCATLLGIAVYIFILTFLARLPVNTPVTYTLLLSVPILIDGRGVIERFKSWRRVLAPARVHSRQQSIAFALLAFVMGMHLLIIPQPESSADGLAMHLAIPVNISLNRLFTYQPDRIVWSVMPMGADWCYTIVFMLGGEFAARLLNFAILLIVEALLYTVARRWVRPPVAFLILALFASTSMVQFVTGSMYVENFLAAMILAAVVSLWRFGETGRKPLLLSTAALAGSALAIKVGGAAYILPLLPFAILAIHRHWKSLQPRPALTACAAAVLLLTAALPAYIISWRLTGDPLFPYMNQRFPSPLIAHSAVFIDSRFLQPITTHTPFDVTFHTNRYFEGRAGSLGFAYLLLAPLGLVSAMAIRRWPAGSAAAISLAGTLIVLKFLPNARYLYPSLPLLLIPLAALFGWLARGTLRRVLITLCVLCVFLNSLFLAASNYYHGDFYARTPLARSARQAYINRVAPMREIGDYMNRQHPDAPVFLAQGSDIAAFNAEVYANGWHQYNVWSSVHQARTLRETYGLLRQWNIHYLAAPKPGYGVTLDPSTLEALLRDCTVPEFQTRGFYLARLLDECGPQAMLAREPLPVQPGFYDDFDPAIVFRGRWVQDCVWPQTWSHTVTYSNLPGSSLQFAFQGGILTYVYTRASNRGIADITIDGVHKASIDLYLGKTLWQQRSDFKLNRGQHLAVITVSPDKNPKSTDRFVDLDCFIVQ